MSQDQQPIIQTHLIPKSDNCIISIVVPRDKWNIIQHVRTLYIKEPMSGPHISLVEPFIDFTASFTPQQQKQLVSTLGDALADIKPIEITLSQLASFKWKQSSVLYVAPTPEQSQHLSAILDRILTLFPQCDDTKRKNPEQKFNPHLTIGYFRKESELVQVKNKLQRHITKSGPIKFLLQELYILTRNAQVSDYGLPLQYVCSIPIGSAVSKPLKLAPFWSVPIQQQQQQQSSSSASFATIERTVLVSNLEKLGITTSEQLQLHVQSEIIATISNNNNEPAVVITGAEVCENPEINTGNNNSKVLARKFGTIEFNSADAAKMVLLAAKAKYQQLNMMRPLAIMAYPDIVNGSTNKQVAKTVLDSLQ